MSTSTKPPSVTQPRSVTDDLVAIPLESWTIVDVGSGGEIIPVAALSMPLRTPPTRFHRWVEDTLETVVIQDERGRWWALDAGGGFVDCFELRQGHLHHAGSWSLPPTLIVKDLAVRGSRLFVSGVATREECGFDFPEGPGVSVTTIERTDAGWVALQCMVPERVSDEKAVDALVVDGDRLIAVDDVVSPKYLFTYDLSVEGTPPCTGVLCYAHELNGTTQRGAALGDHWIAIRSHSCYSAV